MSIPFPGFCGETYALQNKFAAISRSVNWYPAPNESQEESKFRINLEPSPANAPFTPLPPAAPFAQPGRGMLELRGLLYGVSGTSAWLCDENGHQDLINPGQPMFSDGLPVSMVANGNGQIFITSAGMSAQGFAYVIKTGGGFEPIAVNPNTFLGGTCVTFQDGYFVVVTPNSGAPGSPSQFQISGNDTTPVGDGTIWSALNISIQAGQADLLQGVLSSREYLRLFGARRSQVYQNVGNAGIGGFPFVSYNETFIETGIGALFSLSELGDSIIWIGEDARGQRACWRDVAFQPQRVSTFAVEQAWQRYPTISDAVAFPFIWMGHLQWQVTFPTANATWVYDATASQIVGRPLWHERQYLNAQNALVARPERFHAFAFGRHFVLSSGTDGNPGAIYEWKAGQYWDAGTNFAGDQDQRPFVRDRICPLIWHNNKRIVIHRVEFELSRGVGLDGAPTVGVDPQLLYRWSKDAGNTWQPEQNVSMGKLGVYTQRVYTDRAGYARDWGLWLRCSDPVYSGLVNAEMDITELAS